MTIELTTIADDLVVLHSHDVSYRFDGLSPDTEYEFVGVTARTLPRPAGELLAVVATVNDLHFGETACGVVDDRTDGPIVRPRPDEGPYPEMMNRAAAAEIALVGPDAVVVKGDLSSDGTDEEWAAFEACYRVSFGDRLHVVRGNHDAYHGQVRYDGDHWIELPGLKIALIDSVVPTHTPGSLRTEQIAELDDRLVASDGDRVILMGHHQQWIPVGDDGRRSDDYFGLHPDASEALDKLCQRHTNVIAYTAGHTHRHRVRPMTVSGVPSIEIGAVKDFPGTWAEYRVYEGGVMQIVHRISSPEALNWSNRCRGLYADFGVDYETYAMGTLDQRCLILQDR